MKLTHLDSSGIASGWLKIVVALGHCTYLLVGIAYKVYKIYIYK